VQLSLRTRLTAWYSVLLVLTVAVFSAAVLWLHWRLLLDQFDDGLRSISVTAGNVVDEELTQLKDLHLAATDMAGVVHPPDDVVQVLDATGAPINAGRKRMPLPGGVSRPGFARATETLTGDDGQPWRVSVRSRTAHGQRYFVAVGAPLDEAI
jgi:hypothetical protein